MTISDKAILGAFATTTVLAMFLAQALPKSGNVVVFGSPFSSATEVGSIIAQANGKIIGGTGLPWAIVARFDAPDYQSTLYRQGALFVGNADFALSCFGRIQKTNPSDEIS